MSSLFAGIAGRSLQKCLLENFNNLYSLLHQNWEQNEIFFQVASLVVEGSLYGALAKQSKLDPSSNDFDWPWPLFPEVTAGPWKLLLSQITQTMGESLGTLCTDIVDRAAQVGEGGPQLLGLVYERLLGLKDQLNSPQKAPKPARLNKYERWGCHYTPLKIANRATFRALHIWLKEHSPQQLLAGNFSLLDPEIVC